MQTLDENATEPEPSPSSGGEQRIAENAQQFEAGSTEFACECADPHCTDRLEATLAEYEQNCEDGATFMLAPATRRRTSSASSTTAAVSRPSRRCRRPCARSYGA
jgi:hypothetical protein